MRIDAGFYLLLLLAFTVSPWHIVVSTLLAAALHEGGHLLFLHLFRVPVEGIRLSASGAELSARGVQRLSYGRELLLTLSGPGANALCAVLSALLSRRNALPEGYIFAGANVVLCVYNLLPIPPLDGARALYLVTAYFFGPMVGEAVAAVTGVVLALALFLIGTYFSLAAKSGMLFLLAAALLLSGVLSRFRLAKGAVRV